jgi:hypothetical protein
MAGVNSRGGTVEGSITRVATTKHAWLSIGLGVVMVLIFVWGLMLQLQTSVAALVGSGQVTLSFSNFEVFTYIPDMLSGKVPLGFAMAVFLAFAIECAYFTAIIFFERAIYAVAGSGWFMVRFFFVGILLCVLYNMVSDYSVGTLGSGGWGHLAFALLMTFVESFFGIVGVDLIMKGWKLA